MQLGIKTSNNVTQGLELYIIICLKIFQTFLKPIALRKDEDKIKKSLCKFLLLCSPESGITTFCFPAKAGIFLLITSPRLVPGFTLPLSQLVLGVPSQGLRWWWWRWWWWGGSVKR
jgi:hypothetical protein